MGLKSLTEQAELTILPDVGQYDELAPKVIQFTQFLVEISERRDMFEPNRGGMRLGGQLLWSDPEFRVE